MLKETTPQTANQDASSLEGAIADVLDELTSYTPARCRELGIGIVERLPISSLVSAMDQAAGIIAEAPKEFEGAYNAYCILMDALESYRAALTKLAPPAGLPAPERSEGV